MSVTAWKIALRDLRASWSKFLFVVFAVAAGIGALTGVRGFSAAFSGALLRQARTLSAADISVRIFAEPTPPQQAVIDAVVSRGVEYTRVTETLSMVGSDSVAEPVLVSVKAVDPTLFPLYGEVKLDPARRLRDALTPDTVLVSDDLRIRLNAETGQTVHVGGQPFRIAGVITSEPDRLSGSFNVGPRLLISREGLERAGLMGVGSRASQRMLFRLRAGSPPIQQVQRELQRAFPEALIVDYRNVNPNISRGLQRATMFLSLVSLIAIVVGAIGVATAMRAHLQTRMDSIAVMKSIGARSGQILRIYLGQTVILGVVGGLLGVAIGMLVEQAFPPLIERYFQIRPGFAFSPMTAIQGLSVGLLITILFTMPALLAIRDIRPAIIFRRDMAETRPTWREWLRTSWRSLAAGAAILIALAAVAGTLVATSWADAAQIGVVFALGLTISLIVLAGASSALLAGLRIAVAKTPGLPLAVRHALANLYRPGSQSRSVLTALGVGVMFTVTIHLLQSSVLDQIRRNAPPGMANVFFLDITPQQKDDVAALVGAQPGVVRPPEILSTVACRLATVNGVSADELPLGRGFSRRYRMARAVSTEATLPEGASVVSGSWWRAGSPNEISVSEGAARALGVNPGSIITWTSFGRTVQTRVAAIHRSEPQRLRAMVEFYVSPGTLDGLPAVYYIAARVKPESIGALQRATYERFPTVTVINVADILERVQDVIDQIAVVIRFISAFAIFAGAVILASSVAGTRFRRVREMAVFKTLGATRALMARMLSAEFVVLGAVAGLIGGLLATAFTWVVLRRFFDEVPFRLDWTALVVSVAATALMAAGSGWLASFRILGQKPLEVLRGE